MVYTGVDYSVVARSTWPVSLSPMVFDAWVVEPMAPASPASVQFNFESDDDWVQAVFFMNDATVITQPGSTLPTQVGFGLVLFPVAAVYTPVAPTPPSTTSSILTTYVPQGRIATQDTPVSDYNGLPVLVSDFMAGRYKAEAFLDQTRAQLSLRLLDLLSPNPLTGAGKQVWAYGPYPLDTLPKSAAVKLVGWGGAPAPSGTYDCTAGRFRALYQSVESTVQSGPNEGEQLQAQQIMTTGADPSYNDPLTDNTYAYALQTGEVATLTETWTDASPAGLRSTALQSDAVPTPAAP